MDQLVEVDQHEHEPHSEAHSHEQPPSVDIFETNRYDKEHEHDCTSNCTHSEHEANDHADELFKTVTNPEHGDHNHACDTKCHTSQHEATKKADELFSEAKKSNNHEHYHEAHTCSDTCEHTQKSADVAASDMFEKAADSAHDHSRKSGDHTCSSSCSHAHDEANKVADVLFADTAHDDGDSNASKQMQQIIIEKINTTDGRDSNTDSAEVVQKVPERPERIDISETGTAEAIVSPEPAIKAEDVPTVEGVEQSANEVSDNKTQEAPDGDTVQLDHFDTEIEDAARIESETKDQLAEGETVSEPDVPIGSSEIVSYAETPTTIEDVEPITTVETLAVIDVYPVEHDSESSKEGVGIDASLPETLGRISTPMDKSGDANTFGVDTLALTPHQTIESNGVLEDEHDVDTEFSQTTIDQTIFDTVEDVLDNSDIHLRPQLLETVTDLQSAIKLSLETGHEESIEEVIAPIIAQLAESLDIDEDELRKFIKIESGVESIDSSSLNALDELQNSIKKGGAKGSSKSGRSRTKNTKSIFHKIGSAVVEMLSSPTSRVAV